MNHFPCVKANTPKKRKRRNNMSRWKDVVGYEGLYLVSDQGEIISLPRTIITNNKYGEITVHRKQKFLKPYLRGRGEHKYVAVALSKDGETKGYSLHRLVAEAFLPNPNNLPEINHIDENPLNNCVENLEWCSRQYNIEYSKAKKVSQYEQDLKLAEYKSIVIASNITGISRTAINNALTGLSKTAGGYEWKYEGSDDLSL